MCPPDGPAEEPGKWGVVLSLLQAGSRGNAGFPAHLSVVSPLQVHKMLAEFRLIPGLNNLFDKLIWRKFTASNHVVHGQNENCDCSPVRPSDPTTLMVFGSWKRVRPLILFSVYRKSPSRSSSCGCCRVLVITTSEWPRLWSPGSCLLTGGTARLIRIRVVSLLLQEQIPAAEQPGAERAERHLHEGQHSRGGSSGQHGQESGV